MSKRRLTDKQRRQIKKTQEKHRQKLKNKDTDISLPDSPEEAGLIITRHRVHYIIRDKHQRLYNCTARQNIDSLVCGDMVVWQKFDDNNGVIIARENRKSELSRHGYQGVKQAIAANVDQICIVIAPEPEYSEDLINQYLISAEHLQIKPIIVFNKTDKLSQQKIKKLKQQLSYYQDIGYPLLFVSCKDTESLKELSSLFNHKTSILSGQSGVGKSSIIQQLLPDISIQIGELSAISKLGQHTTTQSTLYNMQQGGHIIDSPGIRQFGLHGINKTMAAQGFIEIHQRSSTCKYNNCTHTIEPKCGVIEATENLKIHPARYQSYLKIIESLAK